MPKRSPQKPPAQVKKAVWRDPERQSLEDVASEWGRSLSYVEECVRLLKFNHIILVSHSSSDLSITDHFIFDKDHWPFKGLTTNRVGLRPAVFLHLRKRSEFPSGFAWVPNTEIFIPREEVRRMKIEKRVPEASQPDVSTEGHAVELQVALDISNETYKKENWRPQYGHRDQLAKTLEERHADKKLGAKIKESIISVANRNKKGGAPRFNR